MQIVIDIPEEMYGKILRCGVVSKTELAVIGGAIIDSDVLPRKHGRLIDADKLKHLYPENKAMHDTLNHAKTVIKASGGEQDGQ